MQQLFEGFGGYLQADASNVYDILERGPPKDDESGVMLVGCWAHCRRYFFEAAICRYPVGLQGLLRILRSTPRITRCAGRRAWSIRRFAISTCAR